MAEILGKRVDLRLLWWQQVQRCHVPGLPLLPFLHFPLSVVIEKFFFSLTMQASRGGLRLAQRWASTNSTASKASPTTKGPKTESIAEFVNSRAERYEFKDVLRSCHQVYDTEPFRWTWGELQRWRDCAGRGYTDISITPKKPFVNALGNDAEQIVTDLALGRIGAISVPLSPFFTNEEFANAVDATKPTSCLVINKYGNHSVTKRLREFIPELGLRQEGESLDIARFRSLQHMVTTSKDKNLGFLLLKQLMWVNAYDCPLTACKPTADDTIYLFPTGATGSLDMYGYTQGNVTDTGKSLANSFGFVPEDRVCMNLPLWTLSGKTAGLYSVLANASALILPGQVFNAEHTLSIIEQEMCSVLMVTSDQLQQVVDAANLGSVDLSSLDKIVVVDEGSRPSASLLERAKTALRVGSIHVGVSSAGTAGAFLVSDQSDPSRLVAAPHAKV